MMSRPIVVGVDGSDSARAAAAWGADLAAVLGVPLRLVRAVQAGARSGSEPSWLREEVDTARNAGAADVAALTCTGDAAEALLSVADPGMIVVGSYGPGATSGMLAGFTALTLIGSARCPVAVIRGSGAGLGPPREGPVVVGVDDSPAGAAAVELGAGLAVAWGARLSLVHAWSDVVSSPTGGARRLAADVATLEAGGRALLDRWSAELPGRFPTLAVEAHIVADSPLRAMLASAESARLIVAGQRPRRGDGGMLVGSISRGLIEFATCPVVVAPTSTATAEHLVAAPAHGRAGGRA